MVQTSKKNRVLTSLADLLRQNRAQIIEANLQDTCRLSRNGRSNERPVKSGRKIDGMIRSLTQVASERSRRENLYPTRVKMVCKLKTVPYRSEPSSSSTSRAPT